MGLPVTKVELPVSPGASVPSRNSSSLSSRPQTLSSDALFGAAPAFAALVLASLVDLFAPHHQAAWSRAVAGYFAIAVSAATLVRSSLRTHGPLSDPRRDPFVAAVVFAALGTAIAASLLSVYREPLAASGAPHLLELAAVASAFALWMELRVFMKARLDALGDPAAGIFPVRAWTRTAPDATETLCSPDALSPGDLTLCRKGDAVPADSIIERGIVVLWERTVSGRARLRIRGAGEEIFAGSMIVAGEALSRVAAELRDSRITSFIDLLKRAGRGEHPFVRALSGPGLLSILFVAACVVLGWHELKLPWESAVSAGASVLACVALVDLCLVGRALPAIFMKRAFRSGVLYQSIQSLRSVVKLQELVVDHSSREPAIGMEVRDFIVLDERLDRPRIESALLAIFSRSGEELAGAFERVIRTPAERLYPCKLDDYHEYPGLGYSGNVEGAELSVGSEEFLLARGVKMQPSEIIPSQPGKQNIYVALDDEVVARFVFAEPDLEALAVKLSKMKVQLRLCSLEDQPATDLYGKRAGVELALITGGLSVEAYREKLRGLKAPGVLASGVTESGIIKEARVAISAFNPIRWNFERTPITVFGDDTEVIASVFEFARRYDRASTVIGVFGVLLAVLLIGLAILASLTPASVMVAALSGLTFVLLVSEDRSSR